jgi:transposase
MTNPSIYIGIDVASESFTAAGLTAPEKTLARPHEFENAHDGFIRLIEWLDDHAASPEQTIIVMESTGVYAEELCYFLHQKGYLISVEDPLRVQRAFRNSTNKTDLADSLKIAEYACRYFDELRPWSPSQVIVEQVKTLLSVREGLTVDMTAKKNLLTALKRKVIQTPKANQLIEESIQEIKAKIKQANDEIKRLIRQHPTINQIVSLIVSIPGVSTLLAANLMVATNGFEKDINPRKLAAFIGICPYRHESGTTVQKRPRSRRYGPSQLRKLLYLAAMSVMQHDSRFERYFLRKKAEGKQGRLVLNNVSNKLVHIICAVIRERQPYHTDHRSFHPQMLKTS